MVIAAEWSWGAASGNEVAGFAYALAAKDASAQTIDGFVTGLTLPVPEVKPLIAAVRSDRRKTSGKVAGKQAALHCPAMPGDPWASVKLLRDTSRPSESPAPSREFIIGESPTGS